MNQMLKYFTRGMHMQRFRPLPELAPGTAVPAWCLSRPLFVFFAG